jgi:glycosyltransferase involved in cell wall biosynthesis
MEAIVCAGKDTHDHSDLRPRALFVSHDMLWPPVGGARIRCERLLSRALREVRIDLVVVAPAANVARDLLAIPALPRLRTYVFSDESRPGPAPARSSRAAADLLRHLMSREQGYDVVHLEGHYLLPLVPPELLPRTVIVEHNVESQLLDQRAAAGHQIAAEEINALRDREQQAWREAGAVIALSPEDAAEISLREPAVTPHLIPNGWDHLPAPTTLRTDETRALVAPRLLFLADYNYPPNRDALVWLVETVFPRIRTRIPDAVLVLAGKNLTPDLARLCDGCPGVSLRGYVDDLSAELDCADVVLCPLRIGGGVKVKVIEAVRRACLLVSTTTGGIMGIPAPLRTAVCFADDVEEFADHVDRLCADADERRNRREQLLANQWAVPTWEDSSVRTMRLWSVVASRADRLNT